MLGEVVWAVAHQVGSVAVLAEDLAVAAVAGLVAAVVVAAPVAGQVAGLAEELLAEVSALAALDRDSNLN